MLSNYQEDSMKFGCNSSQDKEENKRLDSDPMTSKSSNMAQRVMAEGTRSYSCRFCDKKFSVKQAFGGHQNAHKNERATIKRRKILNMASTYKVSHPNMNSYDPSFTSNHGCAFDNKMLGVQPQSLIHKPANFFMFKGRPQSSGPQPQCNENFGQAPNSSTKHHIRDVEELDFMHLLGVPRCLGSKPTLQYGLCDDENSGQASNSSRRPQNESREELDLTLKL